MKTPLYILEEHHEACLAFVIAARQGLLEARPYHLLHVDEHADMSLPRLRFSLPELSEDVETWARFVYDELDIGNFIWPLVYLGLFDAVTWLRREHKRLNAPRQMQICAIDDKRQEFITAGDLSKTRFAARPDIRDLAYAQLSPGGTFDAKRPWVLSIDEDYFAAHAFPRLATQKIEITQASYNDFQRNPYHFLKISPGSRPAVAMEDGRFYLNFNALPEPEAFPLPTPAEIMQRVEELVNLLEALPRPPAVIVLCRSLHSGYLPPAHFSLIETTVLDQLSRLYVLEKSCITDHLPLATRSALSFPAARVSSSCLPSYNPR